MDAKGRVTSRDYEQRVLENERRQLQAKSPEQIQADRQAQQRISQEYQQRQAAQQALAERNARTRSQLQEQQAATDRPMREFQQREAERMKQVVKQRSDEYRAGAKAIKDQYNERSLRTSKEFQEYRETNKWLKERSQLDLAPGRPPSESDFGSSTRLRNSTLPSPAPIPINPTKGGEMVHVPKASRSPLPLSSVRRPNVLGSGGGAGTALAGMAIEQALQSAVSESGYNFTPSTPEQSERNDQIRRELARKFGDSLNDLSNAIRNNVGNALKDPRNTFDNLFDRLADPFKKHPRTDPKNDDSRPKPTRYTFQWRGIKFYSPNNRRFVQIAAPNGEYTLSDIKEDRNSSFSIPGNFTKATIRWENLQRDGTGSFYIEQGNTEAEIGTIQPDPSYIPPSYELPVLTQPDGTIPEIPDFPPIFTEDDFKPQRQRNDDQARQDEQQRQNAPDPEQQRQNDNQADKTPDPDPLENPLPTPTPTESDSPQPKPLFPPSPFDPPNSDQTDSPSDRLRETLERLRDGASESFPPPVDAPENNPQPQVTINGEPVNSRTRRPLPTPRRPPDPTDNPQPQVTINGEPQPRPGDPLPDTRQKAPTQTKPPTETRIDPTTGTSPKTEPTPATQPSTPEKCKDPCMQGLHDKADAKAGKDLKVKIFKACSKTVPEGQMVKPSEVDFEEKTIKVPGDEVDAYKFLYERLFALECEQCGDPVAIASVPEWWQARRGSGIPQLAILFAEQFSSGKLGESRWTLCIPHYNRPKGARPAIPSYNKGNWFGTLRLSDGSKLGINAASSSECKRVLNRLKIHIPVEFRTKNGKAIKPRIVEDPNVNFKECKVTAVRADYYSKGQTNMKPDWTINLRQK